MKLAGMKADIDLKNKHQYWIGATIALVRSVVIAVNYWSGRGIYEFKS